MVQAGDRWFDELVGHRPRLSRRATLLIPTIAILLLVAVVALAAQGSHDRVALVSGGPSSAVATPAGSEGTTTSTTAPSVADQVTDGLPGVTLPPVKVPPIKVPPITLPTLPGIAVPPIDLTPDPDEVPPAHGITDLTPEQATPYFTPSGPDVQLSGTISSALGLPIGGACVDVRRMTMNVNVVHQTVRADALGHYETMLPNGPYAVGAIDCRGIAPGYRPASLYVLMAPHQRGIVDFQLAVGSAVRVHLAHIDGSARSGWCVQAISGSNVAMLGAQGNLRTGADGTALLTGLAPGSERIVTTSDCSWADSTDGAADQFFDLPVGTTTDINFTPGNCTRTPGTNVWTCAND
jgi:hypothetical protein